MLDSIYATRHTTLDIGLITNQIINLITNVDVHLPVYYFGM